MNKCHSGEMSTQIHIRTTTLKMKAPEWDTELMCRPTKEAKNATCIDMF